MEEIKCPEKTSAWSEAERERGPECKQPCGHPTHEIGPDGELVPPRDPDAMQPARGGCWHPSHYPDFLRTGYRGEKKTGPCISHEPTNVRVPEPPAWLSSFFPGAVITHEGWEAVVRHVGCEEGRWLCLLEPVQQVEKKGPSRSARRAEFRKLKRVHGKQKAWETMRARSKAPADWTQETPDAGA